MDDTNEKRQRTRPVAEYRREFSWGVAVPTAALVITIFTTGHSIFMGLVDRITDIDSIVASNTTTLINRGHAIDTQSARLTRIENRVETCSTQLAELRALSQSWRATARHE